MTQTNPLPPDFQALIERVQEIGKANHENLVAENRKMMAEALGQVAGGFKPPVGTDTSAVPDSKPSAARSFVGRWVGTARAHQVTKSRGEMFDELRLKGGDPRDLSPDTRETIEAGLAALSIEAAFNRNIVVGPKRGLSGWKIVGLAAAGGAVLGGAVLGGMYLAEAGPFAMPKGG